jgi:hypothetical protein
MPTGVQPGEPGHESAYFSALEMVGRVTHSSAIVNLVTAEDLSNTVRACVYWAETPNDLRAIPQVSSIVAQAQPATALELPIRGLQPNRKYYYQVCYEASENPGVWVNMPHVGEFHSQRTAGQGFDFCVLADPHWNNMETVPPASPRRWTAEQCLQRILEDRSFDFCVDLGDSPYPIKIDSAHEARMRYAEYRRTMAEVMRRMPVFLALGNHEQEAGYFQRGTDQAPRPKPWNQLAPRQYHQKWATQARLRFIPNPRGDTYPEGGESAPGYNTAADWGAGNDAWNNGAHSHLQNFYAWTWGNALFVVLDPFRYTLVGSATKPNSPSQWTLGKTQMRWLQDVLTASTARWKFLICHHLVGGGLIDRDGRHVKDGGKKAVYGRGSAVEADRPGTEQALIHQLMLQHGVQFFLYGHDHTFCHSIKHGIHYICCGRPTFANKWWAREGMRDSYGDVVVQGQNKPWIRAFYNVLGYTRFHVTPEQVTMDWVRTGFSFSSKVGPVEQAQRDWHESWAGKAYPVSSSSSVTVRMVPTDVDGVRTSDGAKVHSLGEEPSGRNYYRQSDPVRPEHFTATEIPIKRFPERVAIVDAVPELIYSYSLR